MELIAIALTTFAWNLHFERGGRDIFFNSLLAYDVADFLLFYKSVQTPASRLSLLLFMFSCLKGFEG